MRRRSTAISLVIAGLVASGCAAGSPRPSSAGAGSSSDGRSPSARPSAASATTPIESAGSSATSSLQPGPASPDAWLAVGRRGRAGVEVILASTGELLYDLPMGIASRDWGQVLATSAGGAATSAAGASTTVRRLAVQPGFGGEQITIPDAWQLPTIGLDQMPVGVSGDGTTIVLVPAAASDGAARTTSRFAILSAVLDRQPKVLELAGAFTFDAISPDGSTLYVVEHLAAPPAGHYQVRAVDVASGRIRPGVIVDKRNLDEAMGGYPISQLVLPTGMVFTLYQGLDHPFIHALDTVNGWAVCIDLPTRPTAGGMAGEAAPDWGLAATPDGRSIVAANVTLGLVTEIDPGELTIRASVEVAPLAGRDIVGAKFGHVPGGPVGRRVLVTPDGRTVLAAGAGGILAIDASNPRAVKAYLSGTGVDGLAVTPDGATTFALIRGTGRIVRLATTTGTMLGTVPGSGFDRLLAVIPW